MNFASRCDAIYKPGQPAPTPKHGQIGVLYDGTMYLYSDIRADENEAFVAWAKDVWADEHGLTDSQVDASDFYGRILYIGD